MDRTYHSDFVNLTWDGEKAVFEAPPEEEEADDTEEATEDGAVAGTEADTEDEAVTGTGEAIGDEAAQDAGEEADNETEGGSAAKGMESTNRKPATPEQYFYRYLNRILREAGLY